MRRFAVLALLASLSVVGCAPSTGSNAAANGEAAPSATPATTPGEGQRDDDELAAFRDALAGHAPEDPDALVAAIEAAGFPRSTLERTRELDSLGAPVTLLQIAARVDDGCLLGQVGEGPAAAMRVAALGGGRCLVGDVIGLD